MFYRSIFDLYNSDCYRKILRNYQDGTDFYSFIGCIRANSVSYRAHRIFLINGFCGQTFIGRSYRNDFKDYSYFG